jgi:signal peptidase I
MRVVRQVREWAVIVVVAVVIAVLVRAFLLQQFYISGPSMEPTMYQDNRVLVEKVSYRFREPRRGEVVVFDRATVAGNSIQHDDLIKRIIGIPGDNVEIRECIVLVNGQPLEETYLDPFYVLQPDAMDRCRNPEMAEVIVDDGHFFVLGDNRVESFDSRAFGTIRREIIVGRAMMIIWPIGMFTIL